ncbi:MAG TPA: hypothetical protein DCL74_02190, partial [Succinivibrionaceae bacterium]|nr:hypothetical protein [Succinivibrionaceae bacterium]
LLLLALNIYRDFGLTCDEPLDRNTAMANLKYILSFILSPDEIRRLIPGYDAIPSLVDFVDHDYGVVFHLPAYLVELIFFNDNYQEAFKARHLLNFIYVYFGLICFYLAVRNLFSSKVLGIAVVLMFLVTPRFFAESFYNGKDLIVVAFACMQLWTLTLILKKDSITNLLLHALSTALIIDTRIIGVAYLATTLGIFAVRALISRQYGRNLKNAALYIVFCFPLIVAFFPYLWGDPLNRFIDVFSSMSSFRHDGIMLFNGMFMSVHDVPHDYVPIWIGITVPPFILILFLLGLLAFALRSFVGVKAAGLKALDLVRFYVLLFSAVIITGCVLSVILLHSSLYNGWRQLYFLYPQMLIFAAFALFCLINNGTLLKKITTVVFSLCILISASIVIGLHPYQNVYFNFLAKSPWHDHYDVDYWGNATHLAYEKILKLQSQGKVRYCHESMIFRANREGLPNDELSRLEKTSCENADFRINNFFGRDEADYKRLRNLPGKRLFELKAGNETVLEVLGPKN